MAMIRPAPRPPQNVPSPAELNAPGVKANACVALKCENAATIVGEHRGQHDDEQHRGELGDLADLAEQRHDDQERDADADDLAQWRGARVVGDARDQVAEVLDEADDAGGHDQRDEQHRAPHEQERHQPPGAVLERFAQVEVGAAGARHRGAELGPDEPVGQRDDRPDDPAEHRLRAAHGGDHGGNRDERADTAHLGHVDRGGLQWADLALEGGLCGPRLPRTSG